MVAAAVAASGVAANEGAKVVQVSDKLVRLLDRGHAPVCAEGIPFELSLPAPPARVKCWALGPDGSRKQEVAPIGATDDRAILRLSPSLRTLWYEVEVLPQ